MLHRSMAAGHGLALVVQAGRRLVRGETHRRLPANETQPLSTCMLSIAPTTPRGAAVRCSNVLRCAVLPCMWAVLWWISAPQPALRSPCPHVWCDSLLAVRFRSAQTAHMSDVVVDWAEWVKLHNELERIRDDAGKVNLFMVKHASTKYKV
jgi:hypothetical protein